MPLGIHLLYMQAGNYYLFKYLTAPCFGGATAWPGCHPCGAGASLAEASCSVAHGGKACPAFCFSSNNISPTSSSYQLLILLLLLLQELEEEVTKVEHWGPIKCV